MRCSYCTGCLVRTWDGELQCLSCSRLAHAAPREPTDLERRDAETVVQNRHLTPAIVRDIKRELAQPGRRMALYRRLAAEYQTTVGTIRKMAIGATWKDVAVG
jgi:uncharacterized Zn finger protein (UPF0148 family)